MPFSPGNIFKLRDEIALTAANGLALAIQFVFQSVIVRHVSPGEFGLISSLLAIQGVLNIPVAIWQLAQARSLSSYSGSGEGFRQLAFGELRKIRGFIAAAMVVYLLLGPLAQVYTKETSWLIWFLVVLGCLLSIVESWGLACFQSRHAFWELGLVSVGAAAARLVTILLLFPDMNRVVAVLVAVLAGFLVPILGIGVFFRFHRAEPQHSSEFFELSMIPASLSSVFTILWLNLDVIIARNRFDDTFVAGQYAAVAVLCKAVFWFANPISTVYLPRFVKAEATARGSSFPLLNRAILLCVLISAASIAAVWLLSGWIVKLFCGAQSDPRLAQWLRWAILAKAPAVCVTPLLAYFVTKDSKRALWMLMSLLLLTFLYSQAFAGNVETILGILFVGSSAIFLGGWATAKLLGPKKDIKLARET